jgi:hypothetical protein
LGGIACPDDADSTSIERTDISANEQRRGATRVVEELGRVCGFAGDDHADSRIDAPLPDGIGRSSIA